MLDIENTGHLQIRDKNHTTRMITMKIFRKILPELVSNTQHFSLADGKIKLQLDIPSELEL